MTLPQLPKQNKHKEADFGIVFRRHVENNPYLAGSYELKDSNGKDYINFNEVTDDQITSALRNESDKGNLIRITMGTKGAADYVFLRRTPAFIAIRYPSFFCILTISTFLLEKKRSKGKSLTAERAEAISIKTVKTP